MSDVKKQKPEPRSPQMDVERFWQATAEQTLLIKECQACGEPHFYPRMLCPHCLSDRVEWNVCGGQGEIYSFSTMIGRDGPMHTLALVRLDEGVTLMTNLVDCDPRQLQIGQRVQAVFRALKEHGPVLPLFTPAG